jgi:predicted transcriptional regulator YdeE
MDICLERQDGMYTQLICAEVNRTDTVPDGMVAVEIPAHEYVHLRHDGSLAEIAGSFASMYAWAEQHGIPADNFKIDAGYLPNG